jgi:hypothetical protein
VLGSRAAAIGVGFFVGVVDCGLAGREFLEIARGIILITMPSV